MRDNRKKSLYKALSWRLVATLTTIIISFIVTGSAMLAYSIGLMELMSKIALYYVHERLWLIKQDTGCLGGDNVEDIG